MNGASRFGKCLVAWGLWMLLLSLGAYVDEAYGFDCSSCNSGTPLCSSQPRTDCGRGACEPWGAWCQSSCSCGQTYDMQSCECK
jgi:hypothetical protein